MVGLQEEISKRIREILAKLRKPGPLTIPERAQMANELSTEIAAWKLLWEVSKPSSVCVICGEELKVLDK